MASTRKLRILPIGGLGEIGMNCMSYEWENELFVLDCGVLFPDASSPGITAFAPDFSYLRAHRKKFKSLIITHGHEDHIGAVAYLAREFDLDIYATRFPIGLMKKKLEERNDSRKVRFHEIKAREKFTIGSFTFDPIPVAHSFIESLAFAIETPVGMVVHSGDYKHDTYPYKGESIDFSDFEELSKKNKIRLLLSDSTNAEQAGHSQSEEEILPAFDKLFKEQKTRIFVALFSSNIQRVANLFELASKYKKKLALVGRSLNTYVSLAAEQGILDVPEGLLIHASDTQDHDAKDVVIFTTGTQAEPQSGLVRMAEGSHRDLTLRQGDLVAMSSRIIPGNEKNIMKLINEIHRIGAEVKYQYRDKLHVSGHAYQDELRMLIRACAPENFLPIHGEYRMMTKHAQMALEEGAQKTHVVENGQALELTEDDFVLDEMFDFELTPIVNGVVLQGDPATMARRQAMAKAGIVHLVIVRDKRNYDLLAPPEISVQGILFRDGQDEAEVLDEACDFLREAYDHFAEKEDVEERLRLEVRRFFKRKSSFKPIVVSMVIDA